MPDFCGIRLLLTEDNTLCAEIMTELLTLCHAKVSCVHSGEEAVRKVSEDEEGYDAVLMDVQMPGMNGYEATKAIRSLSRGANIPVFALTASSQETDRATAMKAGMNAFLQKPLEINALGKVLSSYTHKLVS